MGVLTLRGFIVLAAAIAAAASTLRLGLWQLDRAAQKTAWQDQIDARQAEPPLPAQDLADQASDVEAQLYRRVSLQGRWLAQHSVYLDNRQIDGRPGFYVLTPLQLADGSAVVVQRGWAARNFIDRAQLPPLPEEPGIVRVDGRIASGPGRLYEFEAAASGPIRQNLTLDAFAREVGVVLRPLIIEQTGPGSSTLRRDWPRPAAGVDKHYGYAFQWFALSVLITSLYVWFQFIRPRRA